MTAARGDLLIEQILDGRDGSKCGTLSNELLTEFWRGYPIERLRPLLRHPDDEVVEAGAFLARELVGLIGPVMEDVRLLLDHRSADVRFDAIGAVLDNVTDDREMLAHAMLKVRDDAERVRWNAMRFAALADERQLEVALPYLGEAATAFAQTGLLARDAAAEDERQIVRSGLSHGDPVVRRWAVAAAARLANDELLSSAAGLPIGRSPTSRRRSSRASTSSAQRAEAERAAGGAMAAGSRSKHACYMLRVML
jgi:hypothetical protein